MSGGTLAPSHRHLRRLVVLALGAVLSTISASCGSDSESAGEPTTTIAAPQQGGRLVVAVPLHEPETVLRLVVEPLTTFAADGSVVPYLAESVEPNERLDRWTIRLREGITFHNGTPLDAIALKANLDIYSVSPTFRTDPFAPITATTVIDDLTVEVELEQPWAMFPAALAAEQSDGTGLIVSLETIETIGPLFIRDPTATEVFGTGPFVVDPSASSADSTLVTRNPDYWQEGLPHLEEVEVLVVPDSAARISRIDTGDVDLAITRERTSPHDDADYQVLEQGGDVPVLGVALNTRRAPLDDQSLREALALATDVEALATTAGVEPDMLATGPFGPGSRWTDPGATRVQADLDRARSLIASYEATNGPLTIELAAQDLETDIVAVHQQLADQWGDAGIDVEVSVIDPLEQTGRLLVSADFDAVLGNLFGMPDPDLYYFWWHSSARKSDEKGIGYNYVGIADPALDAALEAQRATLDEDERRASFATVQERLAAVTPYVWLWGDRWSAVAGQQVEGLDQAPLPDGGTRLPMIGSRLNLEGIWLAS